MKHVLAFLLGFFIAFACGVAYAVEVRVQVESVWNGPDTAPGKLYMDDTAVADITFGSWVGTIQAEEGPHVFTLSAILEDGTETDKSNEYEFYVLRNKPLIIIIK